jgi:hypothetical protein
MYTFYVLLAFAPLRGHAGASSGTTEIFGARRERGVSVGPIVPNKRKHS